MTITADTPIRLMVIDDDEDDFVLIHDLLAQSGRCRYDLVWVPVPPSDLSGVSTVYDAFLVDYRLGEQNGLEVIRSLISGSGYAVPTIMLTGFDDDEIEARAMKLGASDYLPKSGLTVELLERSIGHAIERCRLLGSLEATRRDQLRQKDELLSHVSHELRTPVAAIYQFVSLVGDGIGGPISDDQRKFLRIALENVESLSRMINDLLDTSRAHSQRLTMQLRRTRIGNAIDGAIATLLLRAEEKQVSLVADAVPDIVVQADPGRVLQVIINLVDNAIKFTPSGGEVRVKTRLGAPHDGFVLVSVSDTGPGIDPKDQGLLFNPLVQLPQGKGASRQGLGLGLHICKEIVARHGGQMWVESEPPNGSVFCFTLPVFSVSEMVRGTVAKAAADARDVTLFEIRLPVHGMASQQAWRLLDQAHAVVRRATLPGDLVLPPSEDDDEHGVIHVVAAVSQLNAPTVAARIRALLMEETDLCSRGIPDVAFEVISTAGGRRDPPSDWIEQAVDRITDRVA
jgi:two-component system sensor histidine kinase/response regulator